MSFILDALKKSEAERKRHDAPGIASIPQSTQRRGGSRWIWIIGGLLAVNLIVLLGMVFRPAAEPVSVVAPADRDPEPAAAEPRIERPMPAPSPSRTAPAPLPAAAPAAAGTATAPAPETVAAPAADAINLPTFEALRAQGQLSLPDMHIDIHVYSGRPADRFVFINMTKYREDATLTEGPRVVRIAPEGVVLDYFGTRFLLPRE